MTGEYTIVGLGRREQAVRRLQERLFFGQQPVSLGLSARMRGRAVTEFVQVRPPRARHIFAHDLLKSWGAIPVTPAVTA
jgi:hypothetical protein